MEAVTSVDAGHQLVDNPNLFKIIESSLRLLSKLFQRGSSSPKKIFQIMAKETVLLSIGKFSVLETTGEAGLGELCAEIVSKAFFCPSNHIPGFRSLKIRLPELESTTDDAPDNQKSKFRCYQEDLLTSSLSLVKKCKSEGEVLALSRLVFLLVDGFMTEITTWQIDHKSSSRGKADTSSSELMFLFWAQFADAMLNRVVANDSSNGLFQSFKDCLELQVTNNTYHQSHEDKDERKHKFLQATTLRLLTLMETRNSRELLASIECIVKLNHRVVHDRLHQGMYLGAKMSQTGGAENQFHSFLKTLFKTYQELRQIEHLIEAFVLCLRAIKEADDANESVLLFARVKHTLRGNSVVAAARQAIANVPGGQTKTLVDSLNCFLSTLLESHSTAEDDESLVACVSCVVTLFAVVLRNLRLDEHTADKLLELSESVLATASVLIHFKPKDCEVIPRLVREGILLCGWVVDLQNRCSFWSNSLKDESFDTDGEISSVIGGLDGDVSSLPSHPKFGDIYQIAQHELQFLGCFAIRHLHSVIYEKQRGAFLLDSSATSSESDLETHVEQVKRLVAFVVNYAATSTHEDNGMEKPWVLLSQFLTAWTPYCEKSHVTLFLQWMFSALSEPGDHVDFDEDAAAANLLLGDASFFENRTLMGSFMDVGLSFVHDLLAQGMNGGESLRDLVSGDIWTVFGSELESNGRESHPIELSKLSQAARVLTKLRASPVTLRKRISLEQLLVIDYAFQYLMKDATARVASLGIIESTRCLAVGALSGNKPPEKLLAGLIRSTKVLEYKNEPQTYQNMVNASKALAERIGNVCSQEGLLPQLERRLSPFLQCPNDVACCLLHACVRGVRKTSSRRNKEVSDFAVRMLEKLSGELKPADSGGVASALPLLLVDLSTLASDQGTDTRSLLEQQIEAGRLELSTDDIGYISASLLAVSEPGALSGLTRSAVLSDKSSDVLDAAVVSEYVARTDESDFHHVLDHILSSQLDPTRQMKLLCSLARGSTDEHRVVLSSVGSKILHSALEHLVVSADSELETIVAASELLMELTKHKDIVVLKERDIGRVLASISAMVISAQETHNEEASCRIYSVSCALAQMLMQRFPKQLHTCIASLVLVLEIQFRFLLQVPKKERLILLKAREFARLCELLGQHREVAKKHVLGILLDFAESLKGDLTPLQKRTLTPGLYCLLEILSEYEISQLNALMDTKARTLFRSFYESFQTGFVYKGQY